MKKINKLIISYLLLLNCSIYSAAMIQPKRDLLAIKARFGDIFDSSLSLSEIQGKIYQISQEILSIENLSFREKENEIRILNEKFNKLKAENDAKKLTSLKTGIIEQFLIDFENLSPQEKEEKSLEFLAKIGRLSGSASERAKYQSKIYKILRNKNDEGTRNKKTRLVKNLEEETLENYLMLFNDDLIDKQKKKIAFEEFKSKIIVMANISNKNKLEIFRKLALDKKLNFLSESLLDLMIELSIKELALIIEKRPDNKDDEVKIYSEVIDLIELNSTSFRNLLIKKINEMPDFNPLYTAVFNNNLLLTKYFIISGFDLNKVITLQKKNLLHIAIETADNNILEYLLSQELFRQRFGISDYPNDTRIKVILAIMMMDLNKITESGAGKKLKQHFQERDKSESINVNAVDIFGVTPLMVAAEMGNVKAVALLLQSDANPNLQDKVSYSCLERAEFFEGRKIVHSDKKSSELLSLLHNNYPTLDFYQNSGKTALMRAIKNENLAIIKLLFEYKADPSIKATELNILGEIKQYTASDFIPKASSAEINEAIRLGSVQARSKKLSKAISDLNLIEALDIVASIDREPIDIDYQNFEGMTYLTLLFAISNKISAHIYIIDLANKLLDLEISVLIKDNFKKTALHYFCQYYNNIRSMPLLERIVKKGVNLDAVDIQGSSALHLAVRSGNLDLVMQLVKGCGALVNQLDLTGRSPLCLSTSEGISDFLIKNGSFPLERALANDLKADGYLNKAVSILELYKDAINIDYTDNEGKNYLSILFSCNSIITTKYIKIANDLLDVGVSVNSKDQKGMTPLHYFCNKFKSALPLDLLKKMVKNGALVNDVDNDGNNALHHLFLLGSRQHFSLYVFYTYHLFNQVNEESILALAKSLICEYGADINAKNKLGKTPLMIASANIENQEILKLLSSTGTST